MVDLDGFSVATALDEAVLIEIAEGTGGTYFRAEDAAAARGGLRQHRPARHDRGRAHRGDGGRDRRRASCCFVLGAGLSLVWFGRLV